MHPIIAKSLVSIGSPPARVKKAIQPRKDINVYQTSVSVEKKEREKERKKGRKRVGHLEGHGLANNTKMIPRDKGVSSILRVGGTSFGGESGGSPPEHFERCRCNF